MGNIGKSICHLGEELQDLKNVSISTLKMIAKSEGIMRRGALRKPALSKRNLWAWSSWAKLYKDVVWREILYTDVRSITIGSRSSWFYASVRKRQP